MRYGVAFRECVEPVTDEVLRALDARSAMPHVVPIWSGGFRLDARLVAGIRERGAEAVILAESTGTPYEDILAGKVDGGLRDLAVKADGCVIRLDQEPQSKGLDADWYRHPSYIDVFVHVSNVMRAEADVRLAYCSTVTPTLIAEFYPDAACQVVGFDAFSRREAGFFPPVQWQSPVVEFQRIAPGKPIWVFECGRLVGLTRRAKWLRSIAKVQGVDVAIPWDMDVPDSADDFTWVPSMDKAFSQMVTT